MLDLIRNLLRQSIHNRLGVRERQKRESAGIHDRQSSHPKHSAQAIHDRLPRSDPSRLSQKRDTAE